MSPLPELCSTGYCLANPVSAGAEYLVFFPETGVVTRLLAQLNISKEFSIDIPTNGEATVNLSSSPVELSVEWFNPSDGAIIDAGTVQGGAVQTFIAPFSGDAVLYLYDSSA